MDIEEYLSFRDMIKSPPENLRIGCIQNIQNRRDSYEDTEEFTDEISVALQLFLSDNCKFPRVYHDDEDRAVSYIRLKREEKQTSWPYKTTKYYSLESDAETLIAVAQQAPFGDIPSGQTVTDPEVRQCLQITPGVDGFRVDKDLPDTVCDKVQCFLFPNRDISLKLNKINIYPTGGHFKPHRDTPKPGVIGSLVIFGSSQFEGGDLVIDDNGTLRRYNSGIVAFYSSMPHWVEPVTSGTRVTATFYIKEITVDTADTEPEKETEKEVEAETEAEPTVLETLQAKPFGIILSELYSKSEAGILKGKDRILTKLLPHFEAKYYPVIVKYLETYYEDSNEGGFGANVFRLTEDDFICYKNGDHYGSLEDLKGLSCYVIPEQDIGGHQVDSYEQSYIEHVGNECQEGIINNTYFSRLAVFRARRGDSEPVIAHMIAETEQMGLECSQTTEATNNEV